MSKEQTPKQHIDYDQWTELLGWIVKDFHRTLAMIRHARLYLSFKEWEIEIS